MTIRFDSIRFTNTIPILITISMWYRYEWGYELELNTNDYTEDSFDDNDDNTEFWISV